jgi:hypothetical protein
MSMNNEELSLKFAVMENQLTTLVASNLRIEAAMDKISSLDKMIAQITSDNKHITQKLVDVARDTEICASSHERETTKLWDQITQIKDRITIVQTEAKTEVTHVRSVAKTAVWFASGIFVVAGSFFTYLFNTASLNKETNVKQTQEIQEIRSRMKS